MAKMKPKKKDWYLCNECKICIQHKDCKKHLITCNGENKDDNENELLKKINKLTVDLQHGFIKYKSFYSFITMRTEPVRNLFIEDKYVRLPLRAMMLCGMRIGDLVLLKSKSGKRAVRIAQLSESLKSTSVEISEDMKKILSVNCGDLILIKAYPCLRLCATEITLQPFRECSLYSRREFNSYLLACKDGNFYTIGSLIFLKYLGNSYEFIVSRIKGCDGTVINMENLNFSKNSKNLKGAEINNESLINEFEDLNLECSYINSFTADSLSKEFQCLDLKDKAPDTAVQTLLDSSHLASSHSMQFQLIDISQYNLRDTADKMNEEVEQDFYCIYSSVTKLNIQSQEGKKSDCSFDAFEFIGGINDKINCLRKTIQKMIINFDEYLSGFPDFGCPFGALLHGPPGIGKTLIAKSIGNENHCHFICVCPGDILRPYIGESEKALEAVFTEAIERSPSILFIDDIHEFFEKSSNLQTKQEIRITYMISDQLDKLNQLKKPVFVLAATSQPELIPVRLRTSRRFSVEIEINKPSPKQRQEILEKLLSKEHWFLPEDDLQKIAERTHGFFGADLRTLCKRATNIHFENNKKQKAGDKLTDENDDDSVTLLNLEDFMTALHVVKPSGLKEFIVEVPKVYWSEVGGQKEIKQLLYEAIELPLKHSEVFKKLKIKPPSGILMYGPPGCSKTLVAKAVATESGINFISVTGTELLSKWVGESERAVQEVYRKARAAAPCIIFFDEIDALAVGRGNSSSGGGRVGDRLLGQLLIEIDGIGTSQGVLTIAATNRPDKIDKALMRPGRLDHRIYVPLPDASTRKEIFSIRFRKMQTAADVDIDNLVEKTEKYSGAEIVAVCSKAFYCAIAEMGVDVKEIKMCHFIEAIQKVKPRTSDSLIDFYEEFNSKFKHS